MIDFDPHISKDLAKNFIEHGGIKEIVLTKYNLPADRAERLGLSQYEEDILSLEIRVKARRNSFFKGINTSLKKFVNDPNTQFFNTKELRNIGFDGTHKISVVSSFNGSRRTIDLAETGQIRPYYDISGDVHVDKSGHPVFESIDKIANEMLKEFLNEI